MKYTLERDKIDALHDLGMRGFKKVPQYIAKPIPNIACKRCPNPRRDSSAYCQECSDRYKSVKNQTKDDFNGFDLFPENKNANNQTKERI